jgi:hypothetical protein
VLAIKYLHRFIFGAPDFRGFFYRVEMRLALRPAHSTAAIDLAESISRSQDQEVGALIVGGDGSGL